NFPTAAPFQDEWGGATDAFIVKLDPTGSKVLDGSLFGGRGTETLAGMAFDGAQTIYLAGGTDTTDLPRRGSSTYAGGDADAYIAKVIILSDALNIVVAPDRLTAQAVASGPIIRQTISITTSAGATPAWTAEATAGGGNWLSVEPKSGNGPATL